LPTLPPGILRHPGELKDPDRCPLLARSVSPAVSALTAAPGGSAEAAQRSQRRANARKQVGRQRKLIPKHLPGDPHGPVIPAVLGKRLLVPEPVRSRTIRQLDQQCFANIVPIANLSTRPHATGPLPLQPRSIDYLRIDRQLAARRTKLMQELHERIGEVERKVGPFTRDQAALWAQVESAFSARMLVRLATPATRLGRSS